MSIPANLPTSGCCLQEPINWGIVRQNSLLEVLGIHLCDPLYFCIGFFFSKRCSTHFNSQFVTKMAEEETSACSQRP